MLELELTGAQGLHLKLSNRPDIVARVSRDDVNMPDFDRVPIYEQVSEAKFEVAVYELLRSEPNILVSHLLYHRIPVQHVGPKFVLPQDIAGRRLFLFERAEGENNKWEELSPEQQVRQQSVLHSSIQLCQSSLALPSSRVSSYTRIIAQFSGSAGLRRLLAPGTPL